MVEALRQEHGYRVQERTRHAHLLHKVGRYRSTLTSALISTVLHMCVWPLRILKAG
jgi:hypothetical protein